MATVAGRLLRVPVLVSVAGGELARLPHIGYGDQLRAWERLKVAAALRLATALSAGSMQQVLSVARHARCEVAYAPLGVDLSRFSCAPKKPGARLLHVGALVPVKDQSTLLRAFANTRRLRSDASLEVVGDGPLRRSLEQLAIRSGVADAVRFRGATDHAALPRAYGQADVFVLSSVHEAQGMVVLEAAACGVATVGTQVGVVPELAPSAAVAAPAEQLSDALLRVLDDGDRRASLGEAAHERILSDFGLERCVARFRALYEQLG
ncbi:MAG: glycosyltransferase family 4 protein [Chloroflexi bacterium]|nr:glycosyltransferase family 4 protein [Chloroflexota bacterium]